VKIPAFKSEIMCFAQKLGGVISISLFILSGTFSTAELKGYLLGYKTSPCQTAAGIAGWMESELLNDRRGRNRKGPEPQKRSLVDLDQT
jgi:hypothetical protein